MFFVSSSSSSPYPSFSPEPSQPENQVRTNLGSSSLTRRSRRRRQAGPPGLRSPRHGESLCATHLRRRCFTTEDRASKGRRLSKPKQGGLLGLLECLRVRKMVGAAQVGLQMH